MRTRRLAGGVAGLLGCLALSSCGSATHQVLLVSQADVGTATLTYQLDSAAPVTVTSPPGTTNTAAVDLSMKTGTHVRITGVASGTASSTVSCTIAVDSVVKQAHISTAPTSGTLAAPLGCSAEAYIVHRPYGLHHVFELLAFAISLLIVVAGLGSLVVSRRRA